MADVGAPALEGSPRDQAFQAFVSRERDRAVAVAYHLVGGDREAAKDVAQNAFLRAHRGLDRFRGEAKLGTWFYRILVREAGRYRRWRGVRERWRDFWGGAERIPAASVAPDEEVHRDDMRQRIARALDHLSDGQRRAFTLVHLEGMTVTEAAGVLGRATGTVKSHLHRALVALRAELGELMESEYGDG